jgi:AcrR family transcriptional regulator
MAGRPKVDDKILKTALGLFYRDGFQAVGIDRIIDEAGVAGMSVYRNFGSKEGLIDAVLKRRDADWMSWLANRVEGSGAAGSQRLLALFDALGEWFADPGFRGCMFINAAAEFGADDAIAGRWATDHKTALKGYVRELVMAAALPDGLSDMLFLLIEGAIVTAFLKTAREPHRIARRAAEVLMSTVTSHGDWP